MQSKTIILVQLSKVGKALESALPIFLIFPPNLLFQTPLPNPALIHSKSSHQLPKAASQASHWAQPTQDKKTK